LEFNVGCAFGVVELQPKMRKYSSEVIMLVGNKGWGTLEISFHRSPEGSVGDMKGDVGHVTGGSRHFRLGSAQVTEDIWGLHFCIDVSENNSFR
jgi:hypothetical protein